MVNKIPALGFISNRVLQPFGKIFKLLSRRLFFCLSSSKLMLEHYQVSPGELEKHQTGGFQPGEKLCQ